MVAQRSSTRESQAEEHAIQPFEAMSLHELLETPFAPLEWIIPDILPEGLTLFFAGAKVGKSMVSLALMLRMIMHVMGLGAVAGDVLYLSMDDRSKRRLQSRVRSLLGGAEITDGANQAHFVWKAEALDTGLITQLEWWMRGHRQTKLIIVDVYAAIKPKAGDDIFKSDYRALNDLRDFAEQNHIAILLLHHTNKRTRATDDDWTLGASGSMGLAAACDTLWRVDRPAQSNILTLKCKGRDVEETWLRVDLDELDGEWVETETEEPSVTSVTETQVLDLFVTLVTLSPKIAAKETGLKPAAVRKALRRLLAKGLVEQTAYGSYRQVSVTKCDAETHGELVTLVTLPEHNAEETLQDTTPPPDNSLAISRLLYMRKQLRAELADPDTLRDKKRHADFVRLWESNTRLLAGLGWTDEEGASE